MERYCSISSARRAALSGGVLHLLAEDDLDRPLGAHHGDLGRRPGEDAVGAQVLRAHRQVRTAVGLAEDHLDLRHGRRRVGEQHLGAVADDAAVLLLHAGQEPGHVDERDQRDVEGVAEPDEPARLVEALMSSTPESTDGWLAMTPIDRPRMPGEADDDVRGVARLHLEEVGRDRRSRRSRRGRRSPAWARPARSRVRSGLGSTLLSDGDRGRVLEVVRGQEAEQPAAEVEGLLVVLGDEVDDARSAPCGRRRPPSASAVICSPVTCLMTCGPVMNIWAWRVWMMKSVSAGE